MQRMNTRILFVFHGMVDLSQHLFVIACKTPAPWGFHGWQRGIGLTTIVLVKLSMHSLLGTNQCFGNMVLALHYVFCA